MATNKPQGATIYLCICLLGTGPHARVGVGLALRDENAAHWDRAALHPSALRGVHALVPSIKFDRDWQGAR